MGRPPVIITDQHPYHVTVRSNNRDWFDVPMKYCFDVFVDVMKICKDRMGVELYGFVLMSNHFHMIVRTPEKNIGEFLRYLLTMTSRGIGEQSNRINHIFGGRNHKNIILSPEYYAHCIKYLYRNPVKAGLANRVENYPWSTISSKPNRMTALLSTERTGHEKYLPNDPVDFLSWLNTSVSEEMSEMLRLALRRPIFEFKDSKKRKRVNPRWGLPDAPPNKKVPGTFRG